MSAFICCRSFISGALDQPPPAYLGKKQRPLTCRRQRKSRTAFVGHAFPCFESALLHRIGGREKSRQGTPALKEEGAVVSRGFTCHANTGQLATEIHFPLCLRSEAVSARSRRPSPPQVSAPPWLHPFEEEGEEEEARRASSCKIQLLTRGERGLSHDRNRRSLAGCLIYLFICSLFSFALHSPPAPHPVSVLANNKAPECHLEVGARFRNPVNQPRINTKAHNISERNQERRQLTKGAWS